MPAYNEQAALPTVLADWLAMLTTAAIPAEIHVYDDGSTDGTAAVADEAARRDSRVVAHHQANRGHGPTVQAAYLAHADAEWLFQADADGEVAAVDFPALWALRHEADLVMGYRTHRPQPWHRRVLTVGARMFSQLFAGGRAPRDTNIPFRLMRVAAFRSAYHLLPPNAYAPNVLLSMYAGRRGLVVKEIPVVHHDRLGPMHRVSYLRWARHAVRCVGDFVVFHHRLTWPASTP